MRLIRFSNASNYSDVFICPDEVAAVEKFDKPVSLEDYSRVFLKNGSWFEVYGSAISVSRKIEEGGGK